MIFLGFLLIFDIFLLFAFFSGNIGYFINLDSLVISPLAMLFFSICSFKWKEFGTGIRTMFLFRTKYHIPDVKVARHYQSLMLVSFSAGIVSTIQGFICYSLSKRDMEAMALAMPIDEAFSYGIFSTAYGIMYSIFLLYPVYLLHNEKS